MLQPLLIQKNYAWAKSPQHDGYAGGNAKPSDRRCHTFVALADDDVARDGNQLITGDVDNAYLAFDTSEEAPLNDLLCHSITYRIATGPRQGQKVFTLQMLPPDPEGARPDAAAASGFSLPAGIFARQGEREKLEHLARYIAHPPWHAPAGPVFPGGVGNSAAVPVYRRRHARRKLATPRASSSLHCPPPSRPGTDSAPNRAFDLPSL